MHGTMSVNWGVTDAQLEHRGYYPFVPAVPRAKALAACRVPSAMGHGSRLLDYETTSVLCHGINQNTEL